MAALFSEAARGFNFVSGATIGPGLRVARSLRLDEIDDESLLVAFLSELVYAQEQDHLGFDDVRLQIVGHGLTARLRGGRLASLAKPIKAVTFHNLGIRRTERGLEVRIVFDV